MSTESHFVALEPKKFQMALQKIILQSTQEDAKPQKKGFFKRDRPKKKKALMDAAKLLYSEFPTAEELSSATTRMQAFFDLLSSGAAKAWIIQNETGSQIHMALIYAAAQAPITKKGAFMLDELFAKAEELKVELEG